MGLTYVLYRDDNHLSFISCSWSSFCWTQSATARAITLIAIESTSKFLEICPICLKLTEVDCFSGIWANLKILFISGIMILKDLSASSATKNLEKANSECKKHNVFQNKFKNENELYWFLPSLASLSTIIWMSTVSCASCTLGSGVTCVVVPFPLFSWSVIGEENEEIKTDEKRWE